MNCRWALAASAVVAVLAVQAVAAPFVVFPKANELVSPDGRFAVRNSERQGAASDFIGTFHSLWLVESANRARTQAVRLRWRGRSTARPGRKRGY